MKYLITESRLQKLFNSYLNSLEFKYLEKSNSGEFYLFLDKTLTFEYKNGPEEGYKTLVIKYPVAMKLCNIFGLTTDDVTPMLVKWINEKYNTKLSYNSWNWVL